MSIFKDDVNKYLRSCHVSENLCSHILCSDILKKVLKNEKKTKNLKKPYSEKNKNSKENFTTKTKKKAAKKQKRKNKDKSKEKINKGCLKMILKSWNTMAETEGKIKKFSKYLLVDNYETMRQ